MLVHPKTTHVLYEQPSVVCLWIGVAHLVDQDEPGFERLSSTSSSAISASTRRGSVRRTVPSGVNSWRQLCSAKDAPPDDDDEGETLPPQIFLTLKFVVWAKLQNGENCRNYCHLISDLKAKKAPNSISAPPQPPLGELSLIHISEPTRPY